MSLQFDLLAQTPASHRHDGLASFRAEEQITRSGKRACSQHAVLAGFTKHPGTTTKEMSRLTGLDYHEVARRAPELVPVYLTRIDGKDGYRWYPTGKGMVE
jgi:hypothetical protein